MPFRSEMALFSEGNQSHSYFHECIFRGIILHEEDIEKLISEYNQRNLKSSFDTSAAVTEKVRNV